MSCLTSELSGSGGAGKARDKGQNESRVHTRSGEAAVRWSDWLGGLFE